MRAPRPRWRKVVEQPGYLACFLSSIWFLIQTVFIEGIALLDDPINPDAKLNTW
jgi:hypothetical protein